MWRTCGRAGSGQVTNLGANARVVAHVNRSIPQPLRARPQRQKLETGSLLDAEVVELVREPGQCQKERGSILGF